MGVLAAEEWVEEKKLGCECWSCVAHRRRGIPAAVAQVGPIPFPAPPARPHYSQTSATPSGGRFLSTLPRALFMIMGASKDASCNGSAAVKESLQQILRRNLGVPRSLYIDKHDSKKMVACGNMSCA